MMLTSKEFVISELEALSRYTTLSDREKSNRESYEAELAWFESDEVRTVYHLEDWDGGITFWSREEAEEFLDDYDLDPDERAEYTITEGKMSGREAGELPVYDT